MTTRSLTVEALARIAKSERPSARFAASPCGTALATRHEDRWKIIAAKMPENRGGPVPCYSADAGEWVNIGELLIDGKPTIDESAWREISL